MDFSYAFRETCVHIPLPLVPLVVFILEARTVIIRFCKIDLVIKAQIVKVTCSYDSDIDTFS